MSHKYFITFTFVLTIGLIGRTADCRDTPKPEPRPLGKDYATYRSSQVTSNSLELNDPTGTIILRQALSLALMRNPNLSASSWEIRAKEAQVLQSGLLPNPEFELEVENFGGDGEFSGFDGIDTTFQLSQLVELGGKRSKRIRISELEWELAEWDYEYLRLDVFAKTTKAFVDVLSAQERLTLSEELVSLAERVYNIVLERVRAGKVSPVEKTKASVILGSNRIKLERAKRDLEAARKRLASMWGSTTPTFEKVSGQLDVVKPIPSIEQLIQRVSQNPNIIRWATEMEKRKVAVELENAESIPDVTLSGGIRTFNETNSNAFVLGVSIPLPLFDRNQGNTLEAKYKLTKTDEDRKASELQVLTMLAETYRTLSTAYTEATALKNDVLPGAQSAFDAINEGYRVGKFSYLDVLDSQRTLFEARDQYIETLTTYHKAVVNVEQLIGDQLDSIKIIFEQN